MTTSLPKKRFELIENKIGSITHNNFFIPDFLVFFRTFFTTVALFFLPVFLSERGVSGMQIGILFAVFLITNLTTTFPTGVMNDNRSPRALVAFGYLLIAIFFIGAAMFSDFWHLLIAFFIGGFGLNISSVSLNSIVYKSVHKKRSEHEFGMYAFFSAFASGIGLLFVGGYLFGIIKFSLLYSMMGFVFLILMVFAFALRDTRIIKTSMIRYRQDFFRKEVLVFAAIFFLNAIHWGAEHTSLTLFLTKELGLSNSGAAIYLGVAIVTLSFAVLFASKHAHRIKETKTLFFAGLGMSGIGHVMMVSSNITASFLFRVLHEIGDGLLALITLVIISHLFSKSRVGGDSTAFTSLLIAGSAMGALIFGPMGQRFGYSYPLWISGLLTLAALVIAIIYRKEFHYHNHAGHNPDVQNESY